MILKSLSGHSSKSNKHVALNKLVLSIIVFIILESLHLYLLLNGFVTNNNYVLLFIATSALSFCIYYIDEIKELDLSKGKIILDKANKIKEETKLVAVSIIKLLATNSSYTSGTWKQRDKFNKQMIKTLKLLNVSKKEIKEIMKVPKIMVKYMKSGKSNMKKTDQKIVDKLFKTWFSDK